MKLTPRPVVRPNLTPDVWGHRISLFSCAGDPQISYLAARGDQVAVGRVNGPEVVRCNVLAFVAAP